MSADGLTHEDPGTVGQMPNPRGVTAAATRQIRAFEPPGWLRSLGEGAWLTVGVVALVAVLLLVMTLVAEVAIPLAVAAVLAAILVPLTDRLESWHVPRWLGATLVLILGLTLVVAVLALVVGGLISQGDEIWAQLNSALDKLGSSVETTTQTFSSSGQPTEMVQALVRDLVTGVLGSLVSSASALVVASVLGLFMLLFLLKDWGLITGWIAGHVGLPEAVGRSVLDGTAGAFRGYAAGLTLIGAANAVVVGVGAVLLGVPLAGTIAVVSFVTSYVPYIGAFVAGAFAVLIAYGSGGLPDALIMLAIVLLANNTIQNVVEPFAFGTRLRLHPLVVLLTVTTAAILFGMMGAILAAPLASAAANAFRQIRAAGLLGQPLTTDLDQIADP